MIPKITTTILIVLSISCKNLPTVDQEFVSTDIINFWEAYDKIISTQDTTLQLDYINKLYIDKGTIGLKNIMEARNYTAKGYIDAIREYPKFWNSIRSNTLKSLDYYESISNSIQKLKNIYPDLKPSTMYFTIGILRTNGTIKDSTVLIGCEMSFADKSAVVDELPEWRQPFFTDYNPIEGLELLCTHEYIHTQQKPLGEDLLTSCLYEGVAEFVSTKALAMPSKVPAIQFGQDNEALVKSRFEEDMYNPLLFYNWLWGQNRNDLKVRDLGYYIGYAICEGYYNNSKDKSLAIKDMIELDFNNETTVEAFVDASGFLSDSLNTIYNRFETSRPTVIKVEPAINGNQEVNPKTNLITIHFSSPMNKESRGFDFGPLGEECVLRVQKIIGFSQDGKSFTFEVEIGSNKRYQSLISNRFMSENGIPLVPFLIDFKTQKK